MTAGSSHFRLASTLKSPATQGCLPHKSVSKSLTHDDKVCVSSLINALIHTVYASVTVTGQPYYTYISHHWLWVNLVFRHTLHKNTSYHNMAALQFSSSNFDQLNTAANYLTLIC